MKIGFEAGIKKPDSIKSVKKKKKTKKKKKKKNSYKSNLEQKENDTISSKKE